MEYNLPSEIVKDLNFGDQAKKKVIAGVSKLAQAVKSTLGASGKCVIYEDARGKPVITKDGVTVAESVVLFDPVENIGATLIKEAARNTVYEAGDGTTTATVIAEALIKEVDRQGKDASIREIKEGINSALVKINEYLEKNSIQIEDSMLESVSTISCNNDIDLGKVIAEAYTKVGKDGVVLMETSETENTYVELVDGVQMDVGLTSPHFTTDTEKQLAILEDPLVLIVGSEIPNIRKIQKILEFAIKNKKPLLIVAPVDQQVKAALLMNKVKGNIKVNVIDLPGFGPTKLDTIEDLALLTGAKVINEELGDDLDLIDIDCLGKAEKNGFIKKKQEDRLAMLTGSVGIVRVGANSKVELKEKKDRAEDAIYATKAALKEGIVPGGGVALLNASQKISAKAVGEKILIEAIKAPYNVILENAGITCNLKMKEGEGMDVVTGDFVNMIESGIIDPVLVTKSALKNAVSVVNTIISADCVISNIRMNESN
jgi:chaperonin GroEL